MPNAFLVHIRLRGQVHYLAIHCQLALNHSYRLFVSLQYENCCQVVQSSVQHSQNDRIYRKKTRDVENIFLILCWLFAVITRYQPKQIRGAGNIFLQPFSN